MTPAATRHLLLAALIMLSPALARGGGMIHGTVQTTDGKTLTGNLRWDRNENFWDDTLDATKEEKLLVEEKEEDSSFRFLGMKLPSWGGGETWIMHQFSIPFGHLHAVEPMQKGWAQVELKGGQTFKVRANTTDLGRSMRDLLVTVPGKEPVTLQWSDLSRVEFSGTSDAAGDKERLYGTVKTRSGNFTGFVVWDRDESLLGDILDGENQGQDHDIPFRRIRYIQRSGHSASTIGTEDGKEIVLSGTNDVNDDNRGILVTLEGTGTVAIPWDEFDRFERSPAPASPAYDSFDGGYRLHGTVTAADGTRHAGPITWDRDEQFSWETLNGRVGELEYAIPFANIATLENSNRHAAVVHLRNGQTLELRGSNDVNQENKGILIDSSDQEPVELTWDSFQQVEFDTP